MGSGESPVTPLKESRPRQVGSEGPSSGSNGKELREMVQELRASYRFSLSGLQHEVLWRVVLVQS